MLSQKTLKKLQLEQEKLDQFIIQKKNLTDTDSKASFIRTKIALLVEISELANELKTFKHWKSQKDINWEKAKEELIDCFHFYLSRANSFEIDFSDYKFKKLVSEPDFNELLLALYSETETFSISPLWKKVKQKMILAQEKIWEESRKKLNPADKNYKEDVESFQKMQKEQKKIIEKTGNNFTTELEVEKNKGAFYRWLIIFEELAAKMGMENEKDIEEAYRKKNEINWKRQKENY